jgi:hypothetical protein
MQPLTLIHVSKISVPGRETESDNVSTGLLAVSVASSAIRNSDINKNTNTDISSGTDNVMHIQISLIRNINRNETGLELELDSGPKVISFETQSSLEQISIDLRVFDERNNGNKNSHSLEDADDLLMNSPEFIKLKYLLSLIKTANSQKLDAETSSSHFITVDFNSQENDSIGASILLSIKERLPNMMVRIIWSTILSCTDNRNDKTGNSGTALFDLALRLTEQQELTIQKLALVQTHYQLLERDRDSWKDTALKLEGQWEEEKSMLFQKFCTLYTNKQDYDTQIIDKLKSEIHQLKEQIANSNVSTAAPRSLTNTKIKAELPECLQNVPDDHRLAFDDETVRRLAHGQRVPILSIKDEDLTDNDIPIPKIAMQRKRNRNVISGATEYMDADDALQDIVQEEVPSKKLHSDLDEITPNELLEIQTGTKPKTSRARTKKSKESSVKPSKQKSVVDQSDDEAGSDGDLVDKSMEEQILADLEALRNM